MPPAIVLHVVLKIVHNVMEKIILLGPARIGTE